MPAGNKCPPPPRPYRLLLHLFRVCHLFLVRQAWVGSSNFFYGASEIQFWIAPRYNIGLLREGKFGQYTIYSIITVYIIIIIYSIQYTIHSIQFTLYLQYTVWFKYTVYNIQYTVYSKLQYTVWLKYTVYNIQYTLYSIHCNYNIQYTVYSIHCHYNLDFQFSIYSIQTNTPLWNFHFSMILNPNVNQM